VIRYITEAQVASVVAMSDALTAVDRACRELAAGRAQNSPRARVRDGKDGAIMHMLPATVDHRLGYKAYTSAKRGARFWVHLYAATGEWLAIIEADRLGQLRTGAASGIATRALARANAKTVGVIGTGYQARTQLAAVCAVRPIERVIVYGRDAERRVKWAADMQTELGIPVHAAESAREAIVDSDIVITITGASEPVFDGTWLRAGTHINAAGSNRLWAREIDAETVRRSQVVVAEDLAQIRIESGDLADAVKDGAFAWERARRLAEVVAGTEPGRTSDDQITLFESLGIGLWDVALANTVYDRCTERGIGTELPLEG